MKRLFSILVAIVILAVGVRTSRRVILTYANEHLGSTFSESSVGSWLNSFETGEPVALQGADPGDIDTTWKLADAPFRLRAIAGRANGARREKSSFNGSETRTDGTASTLKSSMRLD